MGRVRAWIRKEPVLIIAAAAAVVSCFFVPPDAAYATYPDFRTLALLYCLMVVVAGLRKAGIFTYTAHTLCGRAKDVRAIAFLLVCLCFFSSMLITNDVALLTFVPFTAVVLEMANRRQDTVRILVLQTAAANLGSMLTPVGNPQNLYLYSFYRIPFASFLRMTLPVWSLSFVLLACGCLLLPKAKLEAAQPPEAGQTPEAGKTPEAGQTPEAVPPVRRGTLLLYLALFAVCLLTVVRILPWPIMLLTVLVVLLIADRRTLAAADFMLLLTFVAFFVFAGNLARIEALRTGLEKLLTGREYGIAVLTSQCISNVPAALLLSNFTGNFRALLLGINTGGLGTPIASLASLITLKLYARTEGVRVGRFLLEFLIWNVVLLLLLSAACLAAGYVT